MRYTNYDMLFVGGHHNSAIPIIKKAIADDLKIKFIGHKYASKTNKFVSSEYKEVTSLGVEYINLDSPKFYNVTGIIKYFELVISFIRSLSFLIKNRPKVIFSFGGYLAVPLVIAGKFLFIKIVTHEQTAVSGLANRVIEKLSDKIYLTWEKSKKHYGDNSVVMGLPLRDEVKRISPKALSSSKNIKTIFIQGGKQGSHTLNGFVFDNIDTLTKEYTVFHQTGKNSINKDHITSKKISKNNNNYKGFTYLYGDEYSEILEKSDLVVTRSGAHITYEMSYLKIPSIFVPIPWSSHNEQFYNAKEASKYVPSYILEERNLNVRNFINAISNIKKNFNKKYKNVPSNAAERIYSSIKKEFL